MRAFVWLFRAFLFFALFAFALNNEQPVVVHWFFGVDWSAPLVIVVLAAFALGSVTGVLAMIPRWWRERRVARRSATPKTPSETSAVASNDAPSSSFHGDHPPREGL